MGHFFAELKRRHIYRVAAAYAVVAWLLLQIVNNVTPIMQSPAWVGQFCLLLLALGFPVAMFFAWMREMPPPDAAAPMRTTITDWVLIGVLAAVLVSVGYQQFGPSKATVTTQSGVEAARTAAASPASAISVAVLPFVNLSSDKEQEFFSDGMTEEITAALAKVPDLRVVSRTSAFEFKGKNVNIKTMGEQLGATHLIEGSVRKAGNRLRITAQLIEAEDGTHVWAQDYDRELTDVFAIQEDIARAITSSLNMSLGLKPGENLVNNRGIDPESYEKYLRAKAVNAQRALPSRAQAIVSGLRAVSLVEEVLVKHPDYAPAWVLLAGLDFQVANQSANDLSQTVAEAKARASEFRDKGEAAARRAVQLDSNFAPAYSVLGFLVWAKGNPLEAMQFIKKAQALDPTADFLGYGIRLGAAGRLKEALATLEKGLAVEPLAPNVIGSTAGDRWLNGQHEAAIALAKTMAGRNRTAMLAMIYASLGRYAEAADTLNASADPNSAEAKAAALLRMAPAKTDSADKLPIMGIDLDFVYLYAGAPERAIEGYERKADVGFFGGNQMAYVWHPSFAAVRKTERFKALMRKAGLVALWRAEGWPEPCHPTAADDFECE